MPRCITHAALPSPHAQQRQHGLHKRTPPYNTPPYTHMQGRYSLCSHCTPQRRGNSRHTTHLSIWRIRLLLLGRAWACSEPGARTDAAASGGRSGCALLLRQLHLHQELLLLLQGEPRRQARRRRGRGHAQRLCRRARPRHSAARRHDKAWRPQWRTTNARAAASAARRRRQRRGVGGRQRDTLPRPP